MSKAKVKKEAVDVGLRVLGELKKGCKDDYEAVSIMAALMAAMLISNKMSTLDGVELAGGLVRQYMEKHERRLAGSAKAKAKAKKAKPKAKRR